MSSMRLTCPVRADVLSMVCDHVKASPGRASCKSADIPLHFVYGPTESMQLFEKVGCCSLTYFCRSPPGTIPFMYFACEACGIPFSFRNDNFSIMKGCEICTFDKRVSRSAMCHAVRMQKRTHSFVTCDLQAD